MSIAIVTGSCGLVGSEVARYFAGEGMEVVGIDNDARAVVFGPEASTAWSRQRLEAELNGSYRHYHLDIRDRDGVLRLFRDYGGGDISLVIHTAAQPSHDWAAREPFTDFDINAVGTLNLLEATRLVAPEAVFIFTSTNKVYGDRPNQLPFVELDTRWELPIDHAYWRGIREDMPIDDCLHSLFGASKVAADILVQEYGRYFGLKTTSFRGGTLTGPAHAATELHGFLGYIMRCAIARRHYTVFGYKGKQVRDALHSSDLVAAFAAVFSAPKMGAVYNIGGGRASNVSVLEAIRLTEEIVGLEMTRSYVAENRIGDHVWWISDTSLFEAHYPEWSVKYDVTRILTEIYEENCERWGESSVMSASLTR